MVFISKKQHRKTLFLRGFILKPAERTQALLKNGTRDFQNSPPLETLACFSVTITENFKLLHWNRYSEKWKPFSKNRSIIFKLFDVPITQMSIFILFVSTGVLFEGSFFPVSILKFNFHTVAIFFHLYLVFMWRYYFVLLFLIFVTPQHFSPPLLTSQVITPP